MFDTIFGLPVHALIIHATVVLTPLMCLLTVLVAVRPRLRAAYAWWVFAGDVAIVALVFATMRSGQDLQNRVDPTRANPLIVAHARLGHQLIWFVLALAVTALVVALTTGKGTAASTAGTALSALAAVLVLVWVVRIGHSGAQAMWSGLPSKPK